MHEAWNPLVRPQPWLDYQDSVGGEMTRHRSDRTSQVFGVPNRGEEADDSIEFSAKIESIH